jgi:hypothetical protein
MKILNAEGQSLNGIDLTEECFPHIWLAQKLVLQKAYINWSPKERGNKCL